MSHCLSPSLPRRLDAAETFFWFLDLYASMNFAVMADGPGDLDEAALRKAVDAVQGRHPLLTASIETDPLGQLHFVPHPAGGMALAALEAETWMPSLAKRIVIPFTLGEAPLMKVFHARGADGWRLALVFHHSIVDGLSAFAILDEVLCVLGGQALSAGVVPPLPSLLEVYPEGLRGEAGRQLLNQLKEARKRLAVGSPPSAPEPQAQYRPGQGCLDPRFMTLMLGQHVLERMLDRARREGTTLGGMVGAAQLIALRRLFGNGSERFLGFTCPVDLRPYLSRHMAGAAPGLYISSYSGVLRVGDAQSYWDLARELTTAIRQQIASGGLHLLYNFGAFSKQFPATTAGVEDFRAWMADKPHTTLMTNAGRLKPLPNLDGFQVDHRSFVVFPSGFYTLFSTVTTDRGRLILQVSHDAAAMAPDSVEAVVASMSELLSAAAR